MLFGPRSDCSFFLSSVPTALRVLLNQAFFSTLIPCSAGAEPSSPCKQPETALSLEDQTNCVTLPPAPLRATLSALNLEHPELPG